MPYTAFLNHTQRLYTFGLAKGKGFVYNNLQVRDRILLCRRSIRLRRLWGVPAPHSCRVVPVSPKNNKILFARHLVSRCLFYFYWLTSITVNLLPHYIINYWQLQPIQVKKFEVGQWNKKSDVTAILETIYDSCGWDTRYRRKSCAQSCSGVGAILAEAHTQNMKPVNWTFVRALW